MQLWERIKCQFESILRPIAKTGITFYHDVMRTMQVRIHHDNACLFAIWCYDFVIARLWTSSVSPWISRWINVTSQRWTVCVAESIILESYENALSLGNDAARREWSYELFASLWLMFLISACFEPAKIWFVCFVQCQSRH